MTTARRLACVNTSTVTNYSCRNMSALDEVIANQEIRAALDEFRVSPNTLRMQMITQARQASSESD
jgi:hypothetical protein